ncbi:hypothetical protein ACXO8C_09460, partial [Lactobacillus delbrueckii subsp. bulgaricus]
VNRTQLSKKVLADGSKPSYTFSAPNAAKDPASGKDFATAAQPKETYNVAKAKKLWQAGLYANLPGFYNSSHTADRFSASRISFMHDFPEMRGSQL